MHKLITLSDKQYEYIRALQDKTPIESFSEFVRFMAMFYEQNQKGSKGRPRTQTQDHEDGPGDDVEMYQNPDPRTTSMYSYNDLVAWYATDPSRGEMPDREDLIIHPSYKGNS